MAGSKAVTDWGRKKGILRSVDLVNDAFHVEQSANKLSAFIKFTEQQNGSDQDRSVAKANQVLVCYKNVGESLRNEFHHVYHDSLRLAAAVADGDGQHFTSAMINLSAIECGEPMAEEQDQFWCKLYDRRLSKLDTVQAAAPKISEDLAPVVSPVYGKRDDLKLSASTSKQLKASMVVLQPGCVILVLLHGPSKCTTILNAP